MRLNAEKIVNIIFYLTIAVVGCLAALYGGRIFIADQFIIPTESMEPTLIPGDRVLVNKLIAGARIYTDFDFDPNGQDLKAVRLKGIRKLRHNDIAVFNYPINGKRIAFKINYVYCKRIAALPGDTLMIKDGFYRINNYPGTIGIAEEQEKLAAETGHAPDELGWKMQHLALGWTIQNGGPWYIPRKGDIIDIGYKEALLYGRLLEYETGKRMEINDSTHTALLDGKPIGKHRFKHDYYFMAGDNVCNSRDSRYWGLVPEEYIVGVVDRISYSRDRRTDKLRPERAWRELGFRF